MTNIDRTIAEAARAWPFEEARKLVARIGGKVPAKGYVLFETGYGPSGLPHIGTFGEVVRTTMVRQAFQRLSDVPTRLFCFSDDMDGLRKVPDNVPNKEMLAQHLGKPLTAVPDPFGTHPSFGQHNNARLKAFLDSFGFEYEFQSATDYYKSGKFDPMLLAMLRHYDEVQAVMLPTLGGERQQTYSVFLPVSPKSGRVLQVPVVQTNVDAGTIVYRDEDGALVETPVTGGNVKLQWKGDWAGRWFALGVDYEMYGKDLIQSAELSAKIVKILGGVPPEGFNFELFLDHEGKKISKSKGNGLSVEDWLRYAIAGVAVALHAPAAAPCEAPALRRDPARRRRISVAGREAAGGGARQVGRESGVAHPQWHGAGRTTPAASRSPCCSTSRAWPTPRTRTCCGSTCAATCRARRPSPRRTSTSCSRARSPITRTS